MRRAVKTAVVAAALASTAVLAAPGTASADPEDGLLSNCAEGKICLFDGHNHTGDLLQLDRQCVTTVAGGDQDRRFASARARSEAAAISS